MIITTHCLQYSKVQCSTVQYSTVQYSTLVTQGERTKALVVDPCTSQDTVARVACEVENLLGVARDTLDTVS